jgi:hypothetical protein
MSDDNHSTGNPLTQIADELKLQAWLARAEFRHPSLKHEATRKEVSALANMRDELRVQLSLGKLEARDEFEHLEDQWRKVKRAADQAADDAGEGLHDVLKQIRDGYASLRASD